VLQFMSRRRTAALGLAGSLLGSMFVVGLMTAGGAAQASAATTSTCSGTTPPIAAPTGTWSCTFDDEFNGTALDTTKWAPTLASTSSYHTGPLGSNVCYENNPSTISESGGYLNLSVVAESKAFVCKEIMHSFTTKYEGGMVNSMGIFSQQYGYFEARAEAPPVTVPGLQETLWLYPENETLYGPWPDSGEIDFAEFYSKYPTLDVPAVLFPGWKRDPNATSNTCSQAGTTPGGQFNTYAVMWTPTTITTYYNGVACFSDTYASYVTYPDKAPAPYTQPFFLNLTAALGVNNGNQFKASVTPLPATSKIDWMRAWQY
jgi:beta-glucanase (GH16 family)